MAKRILVVDDDLGMRATLAAALELDGYNADVAPGGLARLAMVAAEPPGLVILDLMMPRMNGIAFARSWDNGRLRGPVPLLIMTADGRAREKATLLGLRVGRPSHST